MALSSNIRPQDLVKQNFFSPTTDSRSSLVDALTGAVTQGRADAKTRDQNKLFSQGAQAAFSGNLTASSSAALFDANPERATALMNSAGAFTENDRTKLAQTAFKIQSIQDPARRDAALNEVARRVTAGGGDGSIFANLVGKSPQQQQQGLQTLQDATLSVKERSAQDLSEREFGLSEQRLGLDARRTAAQERNVNSQISSRNNPKPAAKTSIQKNLIAAGIMPGTPEFQKEILKYIQKPSGTTVTIGAANTLAKATEGQLASAGFANRIANAVHDINKLEDEGFQPGSLQQKIGETLPGGNFILSEEGQLYDAAKRDLITANLRKESGASISPDEFDKEERKLFAQPGDGKKTIAAKRLRRERLRDILIKQSKGVYDVQFQSPEAEAQEPVRQAITSGTPPSGRVGGVLQVDAQGNRAFVFPDGTFEEVQ